jgi:hypothetical protein
MSGSSRSRFTWKEVADVLRVPQIPDSAILRREIKRQKKGRVGAKRTPGATKMHSALPTRRNSDDRALLARVRARSLAAKDRENWSVFRIEAIRDSSPTGIRQLLDLAKFTRHRFNACGEHDFDGSPSGGPTRDGPPALLFARWLLEDTASQTDGPLRSPCGS